MGSRLVTHGVNLVRFRASPGSDTPGVVVAYLLEAAIGEQIGGTFDILTRREKGCSGNHRNFGSRGFRFRRGGSSDEVESWCASVKAHSKQCD
jgi:hypothetical protein